MAARKKATKEPDELLGEDDINADWFSDGEFDPHRLLADAQWAIDRIYYSVKPDQCTGMQWTLLNWAREHSAQFLGPFMGKLHATCKELDKIKADCARDCKKIEADAMAEESRLAREERQAREAAKAKAEKEDTALYTAQMLYRKLKKMPRPQ